MRRTPEPLPRAASGTLHDLNVAELFSSWPQASVTISELA